MFLMFGTKLWSKSIISLLIRFEPILTVAIDSLVDNIGMSHCTQVCQIGTNKISLDAPKIRPTVLSRVDTVPQERLGKLKLLFPFATRMLLCFCCSTFRKSFSESSISECNETGVSKRATFGESLNRKSRMQSFRFEIPDNGQ